MATIKAVSSKAPLKAAIDYVTQEEKTEQKLQSGIGCDPENAFEEMQSTKEVWHKTDGRQYKHYVQSFVPGETTPGQAQAIGKELAEKNEAWKGFEILVVTHKDREHIHNHFIVNSVNYEDGHKIQDGPKDLKNLKNMSDELCRREGLSVIDKDKPRTAENVTAYRKDTYKILKEAEQGTAESYVQDIAAAVVEIKQKAQNREEFIEQMETRGYRVDWKDERKNITFTDMAREEQGEKKCKVRNSRLEKYYNIDFSKDGLENEFEANRARAEAPKREQSKAAGTDSRVQVELSEEIQRMQRIEEELEKIREDRERAAGASFRSGSGGTGAAPEEEQRPQQQDPDRSDQLHDRIERIRTEAERIERETAGTGETIKEEEGRTAEVEGTIGREGERTAEVGESIEAEGERAADVGGEQQSIRGEQQNIREVQRDIDRGSRGIEENCSGIGDGCEGIKGKQQHIIGQQRGIAAAIKQLAEMIREQMKKAFHRNDRRGGR